MVFILITQAHIRPVLKLHVFPYYYFVQMIYLVIMVYWYKTVANIRTLRITWEDLYL